MPGLARHLLICLGAATAVLGQNLCPNGSFEVGTNVPMFWSCVGNGYWTNSTDGGSRAIYLQTPGCGNQWSTLQCPLEPSKLYSVRFRAKAGTPFSEVAGEVRVDVGANKFVARPDDYWRKYRFMAITPANLSTPFVRVEQCNVQGGLQVDDLEIRPALAVPLQIAGMPLGDNERLTPGTYEFNSNLEPPASGYSPALYEHTAYFDWWRWSISSNQFVTFKYSCGGLPIVGGVATVTNYYAEKGVLAVEASVNAQTWEEIGRLTAGAAGYNQAPLEATISNAMLPSTNVFVRLRCLSGKFLVNGYGFSANVPAVTNSAQGETCFFELEKPSAQVFPVGMIESPGGWSTHLEARNPGNITLPLSVKVVTQSLSESRTNVVEEQLAPSSTNKIELSLLSNEAGENISAVEVFQTDTGNLIFSGIVRYDVRFANNGYVGYKLPSPEVCDVAWCENTYKISRLQWTEPPPSSAVQIAAARNEYEPFQVVLRPRQDLTNIRASVTDFVLEGAAQPHRIASSNVEISLVEYVPVKKILDPIAIPGDYPDPIVPLAGPFSAPAGTNQPLWVTVFVPKDTPAGNYLATLSIQSEAISSIEVPIRLRVHNFSLPDTTHTRTAYKVWLDPAWYKLTNPDQQKFVWDLYMENFRRHRISPVVPNPYDGLRYRLVGDEIALDTAAFDKAMTRYLDEFGFNGFSFLSPPPSSLGGYSRYTPGYQHLLGKLVTAIMAHLRAKGWADKAYAFWYDEPWITGMYSQMITDMALIREAAPDLIRLSTTHPEPQLHGSLDVWVPMEDKIPWFSNRLNNRRLLGEQAWWYIACYPRHPYPNFFIDHPAINQRIRPWLAERYDVRGDLYWSTVWYKGSGGTDRNPWLDTMSWSWSEFGNGDGMLLYPPVKSHPTGPVLAGPIDSLRWELVRESMEDGEYIWLLRQAIERAQQRLNPDHPAISEGLSALASVRDLARALDDFEQSPRQLMVVRHRIATAIQSLDDGAPFITRQPLSKTMEAGSSVDMRVEAIGWPMPMYQWFRNGSLVNEGTNSVLSLTNLSLAGAGAFQVVVSNSVGAVTSQVANLSIVLPEEPRIVLQPVGLERRLGESASLTVGAVGSGPLAFYWFRNGTPVPGASSETMSFSSLANYHFGTYYVIVSNALKTVSSEPAILSRAPDPPIVTGNPADLLRFVGEIASLTVSATGSEPFSYLWHFRGSPVAGATSNSLVFPVTPQSFGPYFVTISNAVGVATSAPAQVYPADTPRFRPEVNTSNPVPTLSILTRVPATLLVSTNLVDWKELVTIPVGDQPSTISDWSATNFTSRFYKARAD